MTHDMPTRRTPSADLLAFLAVLVTGVVLICVGHLSPEALTAVAVAQGALYAAWIRPPRAAHGAAEPTRR
ncbi:hypothetical protein [Kitasatospora mediocidica]|uniref:hypothetical protein n=1 Tax=Kitasatospora mediocidica TaxID=58352 RepID=UPI00055B74A5|nr:hypothetical protein [Kitasatospora mediocidica]